MNHRGDKQRSVISHYMSVYASFFVALSYIYQNINYATFKPGTMGPGFSISIQH
jgi:hypothetical protein